MKVCQVCAVDFTVEKFLLQLIDGMESIGWEVTTICTDGPAVSFLSKKGYRFRTVSIARSMNIFKAIGAIYNLYKIFKQEKFDIIHVHTPVAALLGRIAASFVRKSFVIYTAHGFYFHEEMPFLKRKFYLILEIIAGRFTDLLFCQSAEDTLTAVKNKIIIENRVFTIGNGVDELKFNPLKYVDTVNENRKYLGIPTNAFVVGIIARMVREKGYSELLDASVQLAKKFPNFYLLVVGAKLESDHDVSIENDIINSKSILGEKLILLGYRNDTPMILSLLDVFCLPSYREGLPRTIIEAMMMGKPVVASNIRGCRELVIHEQTGLLVSVKNSLELTDAIKKIMLNKELRLKMGTKAMETANIFYKEKDIVKLQINLIKKFIS
jgi:glycosyltransferase involved in cell wall biosynthesis